MRENFKEFLRNFSKLSLKTVIPQKSLIFKESHHGWRIWGNSSLLLLGIVLGNFAYRNYIYVYLYHVYIYDLKNWQSVFGLKNVFDTFSRLAHGNFWTKSPLGLFKLLFIQDPFFVDVNFFLKVYVYDLENVQFNIRRFT